MRAASPVVRGWLHVLLARGEKGRRIEAPIRREEAPVAEASDPGR
jgi:hypothetical protein